MRGSMSIDRKDEMITVRLDRTLKEKMDEREEINWSGVARKAIRDTIEDLEVMDEIAARNQMTEEDAQEIAEKITRSANKQAMDAYKENDRSQTSGISSHTATTSQGVTIPGHHVTKDCNGDEDSDE